MAKNYRTIIGSNLKKLRKEQDLTQEDLADKAKLNPAYYGRIERGEMNITLDSLEKLCDALKVELPSLFMVEPPSKNETEKALKARMKALIERKKLEDLQKILEITETLFSRKR